MKALSRGALIALSLTTGTLALHSGSALSDIAPLPPPEPPPAAPEAPPPVQAPDLTDPTSRAPALPSWLTEAEAKFFEETGGMRPIATYDNDVGLVTIKLRKAGLTTGAIFDRAIGKKYDYYRHTALVETSFRGAIEGKEYLFTGTVVPVPLLGNTYVPVVTHLKRSDDADKITLIWEKVEQAGAERMLDTFSDRLAESMKGAGVDEPLDEYKEMLKGKLKATATVWGQHVYYPSTGWYIYQQKVVMDGKVTDAIARFFGAADIKGAALKIAYQVLGEPKRAGAAGARGPEVVDMAGQKIAPGP